MVKYCHLAFLYALQFSLKKKRISETLNLLRAFLGTSFNYSYYLQVSFSVKTCISDSIYCICP